jgi:hypothetical protein
MHGYGMKKQHILSEIRRTAAENNGVPLGIDRFREATGIRKEDWHGIHWARWSDAQIEAGFKPNQFGEPALDEEWMISKITGFARELGRVPTGPECKMQKREDAEFPSIITIRRRLGTKTELIHRIKDFCGTREGWEDVLSICEKDEAKIQKKDQPDDEDSTHGKTGHVYLLKHGKEYRIGKSHDAAKRYGQIRVQMPYRTEEVHVIETDDPSGIEAYWHKRFKDKRLEGEWFALTAADVRAFKKRRFM